MISAAVLMCVTSGPGYGGGARSRYGPRSTLKERRIQNHRGETYADAESDDADAEPLPLALALPL